MRFLYVNFKIFSHIAHINLFFAQTRIGFLISVRNMKNFQISINLPLIFIKIKVFKSKFARNSWKSSKFCQFPLTFRGIFLKFSLASGAPSRNSLKIHIFYFFPKFSRIFQLNFKKFSKNRKISSKILEKIESFHCFLTFFENFRVWKNAKFFISLM